MKSKKTIRHLLATALILLLCQSPLWSGNPRRGVNGNYLDIHLEGGSTWWLGSSSSEGGSAAKPRPLTGGGLYFNFSPHFRAGANYDYSSHRQEWLGSGLSALPGGGNGGTVYREEKTLLHGVSLTGEYNLLPGTGIVALYAGAGAGCLLSYGNKYAIDVRDEINPGGTGNTVSVSGHNADMRKVSLFIPANLSLEFALRPHLWLTLRGEYRFVAGKEAPVPHNGARAALGLRVSL